MVVVQGGMVSMGMEPGGDPDPQVCLLLSPTVLFLGWVRLSEAANGNNKGHRDVINVNL